MQALIPFNTNNSGPLILKTKLPNTFVDKLIELTDKILNDKNRISHGSTLAGQIEEELTISIELLEQANLYNILNNAVEQYNNMAMGMNGIEVIHPKPIPKKTKIVSAWVNCQFENEYNPIHFHPNCTISSTLYLKLPKQKPRMIENKKDIDGNIYFVDNKAHPDPIFYYKPEVGDILTWPSELLHGVYPFQGEGERRSIAFNNINI
jgi:uncharacterized protein (TIGR02466 family)